MARLNYSLDSDEELPELSTIFMRTPAKTPMPSQRKETQNLANEVFVPARHAKIVNSLHSGKQRPLGHLRQTHVNSLLLPISHAPITNSKSEGYQSIQRADDGPNRASPKRSAKVDADHSGLAQGSANSSIQLHLDDDHFTDLSGFIVPDSASDGEPVVSMSPKKYKKNNSKKKGRTLMISSEDPQEPGFRVSRRTPSNTRRSSATTNLISPEKKNRSRICLVSPPSSEPFRPGLFEAHPNPDDRLTSFPPRFRSPYEIEDSYRPLTPPSSPSKLQLQSPSKRHPIPPSPHRPSLDAFWNQEVIDDWNDQFSPRKIFESPRKLQLHSVLADERPSPSKFPHKSLTKSPTKKDKGVVEQRKLFDDQKHKLATAFLAEVDQTITNGQVASMAHSTGGIHIIWSKKLSSTAGRANWRREAIRSKDADEIVSNTTTHRHHASIELAEKVIDDEDRLINVIAHEYCHLANFMISGIKDNPHGKEFKEWARKCTNAFSHRAVKVTTKHTYTIAYKYIWACTSSTCGLEYKRHSKSIDPSKHLCGNCKGKLAQVQPVPRKGAGEGKRSEYQDFVKRENQRVRLENPEAGFGEIMFMLGREFKEYKKDEAERASGVEGHGALEKTGPNGLKSLDFVVKKLDFLTLES